MPQKNALRRLSPAAVLLAVTLGGCSVDWSGFSVAELNPLKGSDPLRSADYNYFYRRDQSGARPITAADLVGPDGRCAFDSAPAYPSSAQEAVEAAAPSAAPEPINPRSNQALYFTAGPETGRTGRAGNAQQAAVSPEAVTGLRGIALSMTECQVVAAAGYTDRVQISANERGQRAVTLTYLTGDRPGIYHFRDGRLVTMERVEAPPQVKRPQRATRQAKQR